MKAILLVFVPGLGGREQPWHVMLSQLTLQRIFDNAVIEPIYFNHKINISSRIGLNQVSRELEAKISQAWKNRGNFDEIIMVGHSLGALIARKAWLNSVDPSQGNDYTNAEWGFRVTRFVLFAGLSRGVDTEICLRRRIFTRLIEALPGRFSIEDCYRGSKFITDLRISWIRYLASISLDQQPISVQLLGTKDGIVSRDDSIDLDAFPNTSPINIYDADHADLHHLEGRDDQAERLSVFCGAFAKQRNFDGAAYSNANSEQQVLMIVHGIRASRTDEWVHRAVAIAKERWPNIKTATPTYGYLSALRFALPTVRRRYARYFRDFYTEVIARYRRARISILCHSNGTYAVGQCLDQFKSIRIERICLAGSVLPCSYDWHSLVTGNRVVAIRNDSANGDVPVAVLCKALRTLGMADVGTGGFDGFNATPVTEVRYHQGGHDAMFGEENLKSMLAFLLENDGRKPSVKLEGDAEAMGRWSRITPYATVGILALLGILIAWGVATFGWSFGAIFFAILIVIVIALDVY